MATTASRAPSPGRSRSACRPAAGVSRVTPTRTAATGACGWSSPRSPSAAVQSSPALPDGAGGTPRSRSPRLSSSSKATLTSPGGQRLGGEPVAECRGALPGAAQQDLEIPGRAVEHEPLAPCPLRRHRQDPGTVLATSQPVQPEPVGTELALQIGRSQAGHRAETVEPEGREPGGDGRIDGQHVERQRRQENGLLAGANPADPAGMARPRCQAGDESRPRHAHGDLHVEHAAQPASQRGRPGRLIGKLGVTSGEIAECLLIARLHRGREPVQLGADGGAQPCDPVGIERDEHRGGAGLLRLAERLPHPHPGRQRRRRSGHDREAQLGSTAQDHRLAAQLRDSGGGRPSVRDADGEHRERAPQPRAATAATSRTGTMTGCTPRHDHARQPEHLGDGIRARIAEQHGGLGTGRAELALAGGEQHPQPRHIAVGTLPARGRADERERRGVAKWAATGAGVAMTQTAPRLATASASAASACSQSDGRDCSPPSATPTHGMPAVTRAASHDQPPLPFLGAGRDHQAGVEVGAEIGEKAGVELPARST